MHLQPPCRGRCRAYATAMLKCASTSPAHRAICAAPKIENDFYDWYARHQDKARLAASGRYDLVFIGDSITHLFEGDPNWKGRGERVWSEFYSHRKALNLGYGWDRTQNVLWRLENGELAHQTPRLVVLLIGTNNLAGTDNCPASTPEQIVEAICLICGRILAASPTTHILLMAILPRGTPESPVRADILRTNELLKLVAASESRITLLDLGQLFLDPAGQIPAALMDDGVHPTEAGYRVWAAAIEPIVARHLT